GGTVEGNEGARADVRDGDHGALSAGRELGRRGAHRDVSGRGVGAAGRGHYGGSVGHAGVALDSVGPEQEDLRDNRGLAQSSDRGRAPVCLSRWHRAQAQLGRRGTQRLAPGCNRREREWLSGDSRHLRGGEGGQEWAGARSSSMPSTKVRKIAAMRKAIHASEDLAAAREKAIRVVEKLRGLRLSRAAELVEAAIEETLAYYAFPEEHWRRIRTNNPLERILREIRVAAERLDGRSALLDAIGIGIGPVAGGNLVRHGGRRGQGDAREGEVAQGVEAAALGLVEHFEEIHRDPRMLPEPRPPHRHQMHDRENAGLPEEAFLFGT